MTALIVEYCANCGSPTGKVVEQEQHAVTYCDFCQGATVEAARGCPECGSEEIRARQTLVRRWDATIANRDDRGRLVLDLTPDYQDHEGLRIYCGNCEHVFGVPRHAIVRRMGTDFPE